MGVEQTHYVIQGVKFMWKEIIPTDDAYEKFDAYHDNGYKPEVTEKDGLTMIADGMNGEYVVLGRVLSKGIESEGIDMTEINDTLFDRGIRKRLAKQISDVSGVACAPGCVKVFAFTHFH